MATQKSITLFSCGDHTKLQSPYESGNSSLEEVSVKISFNISIQITLIHMLLKTLFGV